MPTDITPDTNTAMHNVGDVSAEPEKVGKLKRLGFTVVKNAASNLVRGGASAIVALALPHFLTRSLSPDKFAAWSLILQIAAYAGYLDFGLQTAIARFLAQAMELDQQERAKRLVSTAMGLLAIGAVLAIAILGGVIRYQNSLFPGLPKSLASEFQVAAAILALSAALQLPFSTFGGILTGLHRNELPAIAMGTSRLAGAFAAIAASYYTNSLIVLACCIGIANLLGGVVQASMVRSLLPDLKIKAAMFSGLLAKELGSYCMGLTVWSFGMLLVSGLDLTLVGYFRFSAVGYYAVAASLITFFAGLNNAALTALMTPLAALHARSDHSKISNVVLYATRLNTAANLFLTVFLFTFGYEVLKLWCGPAYAQAALPIVKILAIAQTIRLTMSAYSVALVSTGGQNKAIAPAVFEALVNLSCSILGALWFGPLGIACGTLAGAVCGAVWVILRTMKMTEPIRIIPAAFMTRGIIPAVVSILPLTVGSVLVLVFPAPLALKILLFTSTAFLALFLFKRLSAASDASPALHLTLPEAS